VITLGIIKPFNGPCFKNVLSKVYYDTKIYKMVVDSTMHLIRLPKPIYKSVAHGFKSWVKGHKHVKNLALILKYYGPKN
jgi:hypothetical protein